jgi:hypothetical protein
MHSKSFTSLYSFEGTAHRCLMISVKKSSLCTVSLEFSAWWVSIQGQRDESISIIIIFLKHISHPLQTDATLHEEIEANGVLPAFIVGPK